jgi:hypothetical protein
MAARELTPVDVRQQIADAQARHAARVKQAEALGISGRRLTRPGVRLLRRIPGPPGFSIVTDRPKCAAPRRVPTSGPARVRRRMHRRVPGAVARPTRPRA